MTLALTMRRVAPFVTPSLVVREPLEPFAVEDDDESEDCAAEAVAGDDDFVDLLVGWGASAEAVAFDFLALDFFAFASLPEAFASTTSALGALGATAGGDGRGTFTIFLTTVTEVPVPLALPVGSRGWDRALPVGKAEVVGDRPLRAATTFCVCSFLKVSPRYRRRCARRR